MVHWISEKLTVGLIELILHHINILNGQSHQLALFFALHSKHALKFIFAFNPIVNLEFFTF